MKKIINGLIFSTFLTVGVTYAESNLRLIAQHKGHDHSDHSDHSEESHKKEAKDEHEEHDHDEHNESSHSKKKVDDKHVGHEDNETHEEHAHDEHDEEGEDEHDHGSSKAIGEGKAIVEVDETKGFKLSPEATQTIKVKTSSIAGKTIEIPRDALVVSLNEKGIYRYRDGY